MGNKKEIKTLEDALPIIAAQETELDNSKIEISNLKADNKKLNAENKELTSMTEELHEQLKSTELKAIATDVVKHKGSKYKITASKINWNGKDYTTADLKKDEKLRSELIEAGAGVLQLID